jgi:hypothetical protein
MKARLALVCWICLGMLALNVGSVRAQGPGTESMAAALAGHVIGDVDGDGKTDIGVYGTNSGEWWILKSSTNYSTYLYRGGWGGAGWTPVSGDFDGDGKGDLAVYSGDSGEWWILTSSSGYSNYIYRAGWGGAGYVPLGGLGGPGWLLSGNKGTSPSSNYIGTSDNQALDFRVNGQRVLRLEPHSTSPNVIGGSTYNSVDVAAYGAFIGGGGGSSGYANSVGQYYGVIGGGQENRVFSPDGGVNSYGTIGGGFLNQVKGYGATIPGGMWNEANGDQSLAAGYFAHAQHAGAFVWADYHLENFASQRDNQFRARAEGGVRFDVNNARWVEIYDTGGRLINTSTGGYLSIGGAWTDFSDRASKDSFTAVDGQDVLQRLAQMPLSTWNYKAEEVSVRHLGPTAQDFYAAFGLGQDDQHIAALDTSGVALAAAQALYELSQTQAARIDKLETEKVALQEQAARVDKLEADNLALQQQLADLSAWLAALEAAREQ